MNPKRGSVIAITAFERVDYLREAMLSWELANADYKLPVIFQCEPKDEEVIRACRRSPLTNSTVNVNPEIYGALSNPFYALNAGFEAGAEFVILGEDDSVVSADALTYLLQCKYEYANDPNIIAVCTFQQTHSGDRDEMYKAKHFASVVWGTWHDRWYGWMRDNWGHSYAHPWDLKLLEMVAAPESDYRVIKPCMSRSQHIGKFGGTHMKPEEYDAMKADYFDMRMKVAHFKEVS